MAEELRSIEDIISKIRTYLESKPKRHPLAKPDVDSSARSYVDNVHDILYLIDGKRTVSTKTLYDILWQAEQGSWETLLKAYRNGTFKTATEELMTLKETFHNKHQPQQASSPDVQTPHTGNKEPVVQQTPRGAKVPVETELLTTTQATQRVQQIKIFLNRFKTTPHMVEAGEGEEMLQYLKEIIEFLESEKMSSLSTVSITDMLYYVNKKRHIWNNFISTEKEAKHRAASKELDDILNKLDVATETNAEGGKQGRISPHTEQDVSPKQTSNSQRQRTSNLESMTEPVETSHAAGCAADDEDHISYQNISNSSETTRIKDLDQDSDQIKSVDREENSHRDSSHYQRKKRGTMQKQASQEELEEKDREIKDLQNRVSKLAGDNLKKGNPNIADLSNKNRPTKLAERFSELYDNEWCDAYEELTEVTGGSSDRAELDVIKQLLKVLKESQKFCSITLESQMSKLSETLRHQMIQQDVNDDMKQTEEMTQMIEEAERHLKQAQRVTAPLSIPVLKQRFRRHMENEFTKPRLSALKRLGLYMEKCVELIWLMSLQDPPMYLEECKPDDKSPANFREYTERGIIVVALVWPSLRMHFRGPVMTKGVAIMK